MRLELRRKQLAAPARHAQRRLLSRLRPAAESRNQPIPFGVGGLMPHPGPQPEDGALIERARHGDHEAYAALVRSHQDVVFRTAYLITRSAADAEDVTQEAF